jgi:hypothetical protein
MMLLGACGGAMTAQQTDSRRTISRTGFQDAIAPLYVRRECSVPVPMMLAQRDLALLQHEIVLEQRIAHDPAMKAEAQLVATRLGEIDRIKSESECASPQSEFTGAEIEAATARLDQKQRALARAERAIDNFKAQPES